MNILLLKKRKKVLVSVPLNQKKKNSPILKTYDNFVEIQDTVPRLGSLFFLWGGRTVRGICHYCRHSKKRRLNHLNPFLYMCLDGGA